MDKSKLLPLIVIFLLVVGIGWFYWYEWRPAQIHKKCADISPVYNAQRGSNRYYKGLDADQARLLTEQVYEKCLHDKGLTE